jgi:arylsulfatase A-like enzyme
MIRRSVINNNRLVNNLNQRTVTDHTKKEPASFVKWRSAENKTHILPDEWTDSWKDVYENKHSRGAFVERIYAELT